MVAPKSQLIAVRMAEDGGYFHAVIADATLGIDAEHFTQVSGKLTGFLVHFSKIVRIVKPGLYGLVVSVSPSHLLLELNINLPDFLFCFTKSSLIIFADCIAEVW